MWCCCPTSKVQTEISTNSIGKPTIEQESLLSSGINPISQITSPPAALTTEFIPRPTNLYTVRFYVFFGKSYGVETFFRLWKLLFLWKRVFLSLPKTSI